MQYLYHILDSKEISRESIKFSQYVSKKLNLDLIFLGILSGEDGHFTAKLEKDLGAIVDGSLQLEMYVGDAIDVISQHQSENPTGYYTWEHTKSSSFLSMFFRNKSFEILYDSKCPIFILPKNYQFSPLETFIFASKFRSEELPLMGDVRGLAKSLKCPLTVVHVDTENIYSENTHLKLINARASKHGYKIHLIKNKGIEEGLVEFLEEEEISILGLLNSQKGLMRKVFNKSVVLEMLDHASIPLLVFPYPSEEVEED